MKKSDVILLVAVALLGFFLGKISERLLTPKLVDAPIRVERDTVRIREYVRDTAIVTEVRQISKIDTVLVYLHDSSTIVENRPVSLLFEEKTYATQNYRAVVYGYKPELRSIDLFPETKIVTQYQTITRMEPPTWQAGLVTGVMACGDWSDQYVGGRARYNTGRFNVEATVGYSTVHQRLYGEARIGFDLIRR